MSSINNYGSHIRQTKKDRPYFSRGGQLLLNEK